MARETILVVDDSPTEQRLVSERLQSRGYTVITASDGEEALSKAGREHPRLVILDVIMPKRNGFQVCRQLKNTAATKDIKVLILSGKDLESDRVWGLRQGADVYLTKPFSDDELFSSVTRLLQTQGG
jgi:twitching motility two-component system response regulator PilH